jgi:hypothetical protein
MIPLNAMRAVWKTLGPNKDDKAELPLFLTPEGWYLTLDGGVPPERVERLGPLEAVVTSTCRNPSEVEKRKTP